VIDSSCRISGFFQFIHRSNYGLIRSAANRFDRVHGYIHHCLPDGSPRDTASQIHFLEAFRFPVEWAEDPGDLQGPFFDLTSPEEIHEQIRKDVAAALNRTIFFDPLFLQRSILGAFGPNTRLITTNGCFDILHPGHAQTLESAKRHGDLLVVLINNDASVKRFKGDSRPVHDENFRALLLTCLRVVDYVLVFSQDTPLESLEILRPAIHVKGGSFIEDRIRAERDLLNSWGGELLQLPMLGNLSTTAIIERFGTEPFPV